MPGKAEVVEGQVQIGSLDVKLEIGGPNSPNIPCIAGNMERRYIARRTSGDMDKEAPPHDTRASGTQTGFIKFDRPSIGEKNIRFSSNSPAEVRSKRE